MVDHVAESEGLRLQLIEYMPEIAGHPEWAIEIGRVHDWLEDRADRIERRDMHHRTRYLVTPEAESFSDGDEHPDSVDTPEGDESSSGHSSLEGGSAPEESNPVDGEGPNGSGDPRGLVEIVDPVENAEFCANCHRVRVTHDGKFKGCLNRHDDHRSMGSMSRAEIRETFTETVRKRVPYYGEYLVQEDGEWVPNEAYIDREPPYPQD